MTDERRRKLFRSSFERDIQIAALGLHEPSGEEDAAVLRERADAAWEQGDRVQFLALARRLQLTGPLKPKLAIRTALALQQLGLVEEAHEVLSSNQPAVGAEAPWRLMEARAALACGLAGAASAALEAAIAASAGDVERQQALELRELIELSPDPGAKGWAAPLNRAWLCLEQGQPIQAARAFEKGLSFCKPKTVARNLEAFCETACAILRQGDAAAAERVLTAMWEVFVLLGEAPALRHVLAGLRGRDLAESDDGRHADGERRLLLRTCMAEACAAARRWPAAIARFEAPEDVANMLAENLCELARCVGQQVRAEQAIRFGAPSKPQVIDMFPFNGEFLILEMKLAEMSPWVDRFVVVEAGQTFTGRPKPFHFAEGRERFAAYADKIDYVRIERFPDYLTTPWAREFYQRDTAIQALDGRCGAQDLVIVSDADEIIREAAARAVSGPVAIADLRLFTYFFNNEVVADGPLVKTVFARAGVLEALGPSYLRIGMARFGSNGYVPAAGWHFSSIGSAAEIRKKFTSFSHTEHGRLNEAQIGERLKRARAGALGDTFRVRDLEDDFPAFLRENRDRLGEYLL
jgi:tetratricopeptide (TPR) repeat protein